MFKLIWKPTLKIEKKLHIKVFNWEECVVIIKCIVLLSTKFKDNEPFSEKLKSDGKEVDLEFFVK